MYSSHGNVDNINNPFVNDPSNPRNRFPDISAQDPQLSPWVQPNQQQIMYQDPNMNYAQQLQGGYPQQTQFQSPVYYSDNTLGYQTQATFVQPTSPGMHQQSFQSQMMSPQSPSQPFQPSSSFGQQLVTQVNPAANYPYSQPTGLYQQPQPQPQPQTTNQLPSYLAQFDPYSSLSQWDGRHQPQPQPQPQPQTQTQNGPSSVMPTTSPSGQPHPRDYIRTHKVELESWDAYAWKQTLGTFDALKDAWEVRKKEIEARMTQLQTQMQLGYADGYYGAQEGSRLQLLVKEANANVDAVVASSFQMHEVFSGYRQSSDLASKRRVRESCNAAVNNLPEWPGPY